MTTSDFPSPGYYYKKPVTVKAEQTKVEKVIDTLEGPVTAKVGSWIITGVEGEQWPVQDSIFRKTYALVENEEEA